MTCLILLLEIKHTGALTSKLTNRMPLNKALLLSSAASLLVCCVGVGLSVRWPYLICRLGVAPRFWSQVHVLQFNGDQMDHTRNHCSVARSATVSPRAVTNSQLFDWQKINWSVFALLVNHFLLFSSTHGLVPVSSVRICWFSLSYVIVEGEYFYFF